MFKCFWLFKLPSLCQHLVSIPKRFTMLSRKHTTKSIKGQGKMYKQHQIPDSYLAVDRGLRWKVHPMACVAVSCTVFTYGLQLIQTEQGQVLLVFLATFCRRKWRGKNSVCLWSGQGRRRRRGGPVTHGCSDRYEDSLICQNEAARGKLGTGEWQMGGALKRPGVRIPRWSVGMHLFRRSEAE